MKFIKAEKEVISNTKKVITAKAGDGFAKKVGDETQKKVREK